MDDEERELGLTCIAVPIMKGSTKQVVAAISLSGPTTRIKDSTYETKIKRLMEVGREISEKLKSVSYTHLDVYKRQPENW